jgi:hypothetical protein
MDEKRNSQRSRTLKGGTISFGGGGAIDCTIRNLTSSHSTSFQSGCGGAGVAGLDLINVKYYQN